MEFQESIKQYAESPLNMQALLAILKQYKRPYDKISHLVSEAKLVRIKRGIYVPGPHLNLALPSNFLLANHLSGPSYVSMETALSYWGLIPERVYEISSITTQKSTIYQTPVGRFSYTNIVLPYFSFGIQRVKLTEKQSVLMASPEKAICDKIITTAGILLRSTTQVKEWLIENQRIEKDLLRNLNHQEISKWIIDAPKKNSLVLLVKTLKNL